MEGIYYWLCYGEVLAMRVEAIMVLSVFLFVAGEDWAQV